MIFVPLFQVIFFSYILHCVAEVVTDGNLFLQ